MKTKLFQLCAACWFTTAALTVCGAPPFVYETSFEFQANADFDGDGRLDLILVDKSTGDYRIGYQLAPGTYTWIAARASGIANATGLGLGRINSLAYDSLAVTGSDANRINLVDATSTNAAGLPTSVFIPSIGPNQAVAIDIGGPTNTTLVDLYVTSLYNSTNPYHETLIRNNGGTNQTSLADNLILSERERGNAVLVHTNRAPLLSLFQRNVSPGIDYLTLFDLSPGIASNLTSVATTRTPQPYEYVSAQFVSTNPFTQFLLYPPGGWYFYAYQVTQPAPGAYSLVWSNTFLFPDYMLQVFVLPATNGNRLLTINTNQTTATVFSFDGLTAPVVLQQFSAAAGEHFTGAGVLGNGGFMAYSAPVGQNTSSKFKQWAWNGSAYTNTASGSLPLATAYTASGNVMQFQFEPFITNNPVLLRLNSAGDWTSGVTFSGLPGNISVRTETFLSATQGLANPSLTILGAAHPLAAFGLANQYSNMISLFSFTPPAGDKISDVTISPLPGLYQSSVQLQFTAATPSDNIFFRVGPGNWTTWSNGLYVPVFTNTVVQYYGQPSGGNPKSAVKFAAYSFTKGPSTLDSKGDGIPDYVKIALGLPLTGSRDSDGDGYSDLEELIHGMNPLDASSVPTNFPHLDDQAVFDLLTTPAPWDGFANASSLCSTGAVLQALDFQGSLLGSGVMSNDWPALRVTNIIIVAEDRLVVAATDLHYPILTTNTDTKVGREMLGLVPLPALQFPTISNTFTYGNITNEAYNWIAAASNAYNHLPRAVVTNALTINNTLESLLFELKTAQLLGARSNAWWTNITLFPFRSRDAGRTNPSQSMLLSLETATTNQPGYGLTAMYATISNQVEHAGSAGIAALRAVVQDIYRIDSLLNNTNPAMFVSPVDEIRYFLWNGTMDTNYLPWATTAPVFASATSGGIAVLSAVSSRPTTNLLLNVRSDTLAGNCRLLDFYGGGATFSLLDASGQPFGFPDNFQLIAGCVVQVSGYTDVTNPVCGYPAIEVTSALLSSVPIAMDTDANGNLLLDSWEQKFFGGVGLASPFVDSDHDGYSNLQEMLEGSDPRDPYDRPSVAPVNFAPPVLSLREIAGQVEIHFTWPAYYVNRFNYGVRHTSAVNLPFVNLVVPGPVNVAGDEFKITFPVPASAQHFYYWTVSLK